MGVTIKSEDNAGEQEAAAGAPVIQPADPEVTEESAAKEPVDPTVAAMDTEVAEPTPVEAPVAAAAPATAVPDAKSFAYRVSAWFANVEHLLSAEEQKLVAKVKGAALSKYTALVKADAEDVVAKIKALEGEAAAEAKKLKDKYL